EAAVLATWHIQAMTIGIGTALVMGCLALLIKVIRNQFQSLVVSHLHLDSALGNMTQGLLMFDGSGKLVLSNRRYAEMFKLPWEKWSIAARGLTLPRAMQLGHELNQDV